MLLTLRGSATNNGVMTLRVPRFPFSLDPLIAEAKRQTQRRRVLVAAAAVLIAAATAGAFGLRSSGRVAVFCAQVPSGWQARSVQHFGRTDLVLTNFRFGDFADNDGLLDGRTVWPPNGTMIAVLNWRISRSKQPPAASRLYVRRSQFVSDGNAPHPISSRLIRYQAHDVLLWVEVQSSTAAAVAAANRALAGIHTCNA
jgi:hypothetical protein